MVCYIRKYVIILGDIAVDVPPNQNIGGCVPGIPGGVDASAFWYRLTRVVLETEPLNGCVC